MEFQNAVCDYTVLLKKNQYTQTPLNTHGNTLSQSTFPCARTKHTYTHALSHAYFTSLTRRSRW
jgi:hypothetical protein